MAHCREQTGPAGGDDLPVSVNGKFTFDTALNDGSSYVVTVKTQPTGPAQFCTVSSGSGVITSADVTHVWVSCAATCNEKTVSGVTVDSAAAWEACDSLIIGPSFTAEDGASVTLSSGREIKFESGVLIELGATLDTNVCGQSLCMTSPNPMPYGCHSCVDQICDIESSSSCCGVEFDQACVDKVNTVCGLVCE